MASSCFSIFGSYFLQMSNTLLLSDTTSPPFRWRWASGHLPKAIWKFKCLNHLRTPLASLAQIRAQTFLTHSAQDAAIPATLRSICLSGSSKAIGTSLRDIELRAKNGLSTWGLSLQVLEKGSKSSGRNSRGWARSGIRPVSPVRS